MPVRQRSAGGACCRKIARGLVEGGHEVRDPPPLGSGRAERRGDTRRRRHAGASRAPTPSPPGDGRNRLEQAVAAGNPGGPSDAAIDCFMVSEPGQGMPRPGECAPLVEGDVSILAAGRASPLGSDRAQVESPGETTRSVLGTGSSGSAAALSTGGQTACQRPPTRKAAQVRQLPGIRRPEKGTLGYNWAPAQDRCRCRPGRPARVRGNR
jgi:hypothetical protein